MSEYNYHYKYPHPSVTTDCVIFGVDGNSLNVLLIERGNEPFKGRWAFPGGFLNMDESAEDGALRELQEETGLTGAYIKQFHTFTAPDRDPRERVISIAYYAIVPQQDVKGGDDAAKAQWFALNNVPPLAFDHDEMLRMAEQELLRLGLLTRLDDAEPEAKNNNVPRYRFNREAYENILKLNLTHYEQPTT